MVQLSMSEIRTIQLRPKCPKSERLLTKHEFVRISASFEIGTFGFRTLTVHTVNVQIPNVQKQNNVEIRIPVR